MIKKGRIINYSAEYLNLNTMKDSSSENLTLGSADFLLYDGKHVFAGRHILFDFIGSPYTKDTHYIEEVLKNSAKKAGAEIVQSCFHVFGPENGFSGVLVLKESHISVHTWPESDLMTFDIFMCGLCNPYLSFEYLVETLEPKTIKMMYTRRGCIR